MENNLKEVVETSDISPEWHDLVPRCTDRCPHHDGKRCELLGHRPSDLCEPAIALICDKANQVVAATSDKVPFDEYNFDESVKRQKAAKFLLENDPVVRAFANASCESSLIAVMIAAQHGDLINSRITETAKRMEVTDQDRKEGHPRRTGD